MFFLLSDINECDMNNGDCEHLCVNKEGSFECKCNVGYRLQPDKKTCKGMSFDNESECPSYYRRLLQTQLT